MIKAIFNRKIQLSLILWLLAACSNTNDNNIATQGTTKPRSEPPDNSQVVQNQKQHKSTKEAVGLNQTQIYNIEDLSQQLQRAGSVEEKTAQRFLETGNRFAKEADRLLQKGHPETVAEQDQWGMAAKSYGAALQYKPSTEALIGYAKSDVMIDLIRPTKQKSIAAKLPLFKRAIKNYQLAIALGDRTGKPLSAQQRQEVDRNISCLEAFLKKPNPAQPNCQLVKDALKVSQIN